MCFLHGLKGRISSFISILGNEGQMGLLKGCSNNICRTTRAVKACHNSPKIAENKSRDLRKKDSLKDVPSSQRL